MTSKKSNNNHVSELLSVNTIFVGYVAYLDAFTLQQIPLVCKQWSRWLQDEVVWKTLCKSRYPSINLLQNSKESSTLALACALSN
jgi:hypothetical protein